MRTKKIVFGAVIVFSLLLLIGALYFNVLSSSVSAKDLNNITLKSSDLSKTYDSQKQIVKIKDKTLGDISNIQLLTPLVYQVPICQYFLENGKTNNCNPVAEVNITFYEKPTKFLDGMEFKDKNKNNQIINKNFDYKYLATQQVSVDDYKCQNQTNSNGTISSVCVVSGSHKEDRQVWLPFDDAKPNKGETYTIGIFTDVGMDETVEWIPTWFNTNITEWAVYTSGATTSYDGPYTVLTYLNSGTFNITESIANISYLVIAGGGGGDSCYAGGAGGAGGYIYKTGQNFSIGNYSIIVGSGGISYNDGCPGTTSTNGGNSSFNGDIAIGGGRGGKYNGGAGANGGSGGGGADTNGAGGLGTAGQGNAGGLGGSSCGGGGGGGAGQNGSACSSNSNGGNGTANSITGTSTYYAGGGAGGRVSGSSYGGLGGGGNWTGGVGGTNGINGTGGGGASTKSGGSGVVIIKYLPIAVCQFSGYVFGKDNTDPLNGANVTITNQHNPAEYYQTTTNSSGYWSFNITNSTNIYKVDALYNSTIPGKLEHDISGTC